MPRKKTAETAPPDRVLGTRDLAHLLTPQGADGPSPRTIERWRTTGEGPKFIKIGRRVLYRESAVERWLTQRTRSQTDEISADRRR